MKRKLTPGFILRAPKPTDGKDRVTYWDAGLGLMVTANGHKSFVVQYRAGGVSRRMSLKAGLSLQEARREARKILGDVAKGGDPLTEKRKADGATLRAVVQEYYDLALPKLRSGNARKLVIERLVLPVMGARKIESIKRSEIVRLLDRIEVQNGPHQSQAVLAFLSKIFNWHASRDDDFLSPIRRGMARVSPKDHARDRVLSDDELRAIWRAAERFSGPFGYLVRFLLLTAVRRSEAGEMSRAELHGDDWIIPAARMKGKQEHVVPLSADARALLDGMPNLGPFVFSHTGLKPSNNFDLDKKKIDELSGVTGWRLHDLRRTARSLMSRVGVNADVAERVLAHTVGGIRGTYDRYGYYAEKKAALELLAAEIQRIMRSASP